MAYPRSSRCHKTVKTPQAPTMGRSRQHKQTPHPGRRSQVGASTWPPARAVLLEAETDRTPTMQKVPKTGVPKSQARNPPPPRPKPETIECRKVPPQEPKSNRKVHPQKALLERFRAVGQEGARSPRVSSLGLGWAHRPVSSSFKNLWDCLTGFYL